MYRFFLSTLCLFFCLTSITAGTNTDEQLWLGGEFNYNFKRKFLLQGELDYKTLLAGGPSWYSINTSPLIEYSLSQRIDLIAGTPMSYTHQQGSINTYELSTLIGCRIYLTPHARTQVRLLTRMEERWNYSTKSDSWETSPRLRIRGECIYPINRKTYYEDKMWYVLSDAEVFITGGSDINERFANRLRLRTGAGYQLNKKIRFEGIYNFQMSRNTINDKLNSLSNIFYFRVKYYLE